MLLLWALAAISAREEKEEKASGIQIIKRRRRKGKKKKKKSWLECEKGAYNSPLIYWSQTKLLPKEKMAPLQRKKSKKKWKEKSLAGY